MFGKITLLLRFCIKMAPLKLFQIQTNDDKKQNSCFAPFFLCLIIFAGLSICTRATNAETGVVDTAVISMATSTDTSVQETEDEETKLLKEKVSQKNTELEELKKQIDTYEKQLNFTQSEAKTLQNTVKSLDLDRQKMSTSIKLTEKQLEASMLNFTELNLGIKETEEKIALVGASVSEILRTIDRSDSKTIVETVLSSKKLSDILDEGMQLSQLREQVREHIKELGAYKNDLLTEKGKVETEKKKLANYKSTLSDKKSVLDGAKKEKTNLLTLTRNRESDYQKILDANLAKKEAFEKELFDYESKLTRQLDRKYIPVAGTKILLWPLDDIFITQHFGKTKDSVRLYASGTHNGTDFRANRGTAVKSPAKGEVIATGNTDITCPKASYGKWVLIRHDNGLTSLLGHLDVIKVGSGQNVEAGDLVAYSGNTGYSTGPHLHMTLFASNGVQVGSFASKSCSGKDFTMPLPTAKNAYLDPESYLPDL